ncbi:serine hydrolase [uncultured Tateyamaria sp.]|uniref:serine hydrolase n=1 Tax=uncultured Tateyamaria sp. TaxID=455651 RepID=UPI002608F036|nr:serine hydrolase [uncultured Tateyamaria sp.]
MIRFRHAAFALFAFLMPAQGAEFTPVPGNTGPSWRDISAETFDANVTRYRAQGFRIGDVDVYKDGSRTRYAQNWRRNDGRDWAVEHDLTSAQYSARFSVHTGNGMRATDIEGFRKGGNTTFAGVWIENRENIGWALWRNLSGTSFREKNQEQAARGRVIVDAEAYMTDDGLRFAAIWYDDPRPQDTFFRRGIDRATYQDLVNEKTAQGFRLVDYERYENDSGNIRYIVLFKRGIQGRVTVRTNRSAMSYTNLFRQLNDEGYRPVDFEREGDSYGAIWMEAYPDRARYAGKAQLDQLLDGLIPSMGSNAPAGVSAAIVLNGTRIWQRGDGFSDVSAGRAANASTVYYLASVSKAVAGSLFGRLEERGRLENGRPVSIASTDFTRTHLPELPGFHTHRLSNLLGHTACIGSYGRGHQPDNRDYTSHFQSQRDALSRYDDTPLIQFIDGVAGCTIGQTRTYSNHGYGMLGAAMESATGRAYKDLLRSELADPFGLPSLRAMYADRRPVETSHRTKPYRTQTNSTSYDNSSWKVTVGGTEANAMDLARLGWLAGSARLTSAAFRDNVMFNPLPNAGGRAYAWNVGTDAGGRRLVSHNGASTGSRTFLWVWPDQGLSIAFLANRNYPRGDGAPPDPLPALLQNMANVVFANQP